MGILPKAVTFICVGNICRSPLAHLYMEFLVSHHKNSEIRKIQFDSAGTNGGNLSLVDRTRVFLESHGIDTLNFKSKKVSTEYFRKFDLIIVMEEYMKPYIIKYYFNHEDPAEKSKIANNIYVFGDICDLDTRNINDPYLESDVVYQGVINLLHKGCHNLLKRWEKLKEQSWNKKIMLQMRQILGYNIYE